MKIKVLFFLFFVNLLFTNCEAQVNEVYTTINDEPITKSKTLILDSYKTKVYYDNMLKIEVNYIVNRALNKRNPLIHSIIYYPTLLENKEKIREKLLSEYGTFNFGLDFVTIKEQGDLKAFYINSNIDDDKYGLEYNEIRVENQKRQIV